MTEPSHRNQQTGDAALDRIQSNVRSLIATLRLVPFLLSGRLVSVTFAASTRKVVRHGLGARAACFVVRMNYDSAMASQSFAESSDQTTGCDPTQQLALICDAAVTVDLWFYPRASKTIDTNLGQSP